MSATFAERKATLIAQTIRDYTTIMPKFEAMIFSASDWSVVVLSRLSYFIGVRFQHWIYMQQSVEET